MACESNLGREQAPLGLVELSERCHISPATINRYLNAISAAPPLPGKTNGGSIKQPNGYDSAMTP